MIRQATRSDADRIRELCDQLGYAISLANAQDRIATAISPDRDVVVYEQDGSPFGGTRVVAWMELSHRRALESGEWGEISGLVVDESVRGRGVGAALIRYAEEWTRQRGLSRLRVRTNDARKDAHRFYEREGFTLRKMHRVYDKACEP